MRVFHIFCTHFPFSSSIHGSFPKILQEFLEVLMLYTHPALCGSRTRAMQKLLTIFIQKREGKFAFSGIILLLLEIRPSETLVPSIPSARLQLGAGLCSFGCCPRSAKLIKDKRISCRQWGLCSCRSRDKYFIPETGAPKLICVTGVTFPYN